MQRIRSHQTFLLFAGLSLAALALAAYAAQTRSADLEVYRVDRRAEWQQWTFPAGTLAFSPTGSVTPVEFKGVHNAAVNADEFTHELVSGKEMRGGAWKAGTNLSTAGRAIDGRAQTFWQPDPDAPLEDWWIEINLGRAVLVSEIRLIFPDREGARPFREFRVFGSEGRRVTRQDIFSFHLIGGTTKPIDETVVSYDVKPLVREVTRVRGAREEGTADTTYDLLQFIRILVDAKTPDAALAEVEVYTLGENIALQTLERGGAIQERSGRGFPFKMADGNANTDWGARRERGQDPIAWDWDLGALFWVDRIVMRTSDFLLRTLTYGSNLPQIRTHSLSVSNGRRTLTGEVDLDQLFVGDTDALLASSTEFPGQLTYLFEPRPVRFIAAEWVGGGGSQTSFQFQSGFLIETLVFAVGHVAQVEMSSDFIDLGRIAGRQPGEGDQIPALGSRPALGRSHSGAHSLGQRAARKFSLLPQGWQRSNGRAIRSDAKATARRNPEHYRYWRRLERVEQLLPALRRAVPLPQPAPFRPSPAHPQFRPSDHRADCARLGDRIY